MAYPPSTTKLRSQASDRVIRFTSLEQERPFAFDLYFPYTSNLEVKQSREFLISGASD